MNNQKQKKNSGFVIQGMILACASIVVRVIGLIYRIPLTNILGDEGNAFYSNAFEVYNIALLLSSYSIPLAVSKLVSARVGQGERSNAYRVFKGAFVFAAIVGLLVSIIIYVGANFIAGNLMKMEMSSYALKVLAPCLFIVAILGVMRGYCQGMGTTIPTALSQIFEQIINAIVSIVAASYLFKAGVAIAETSGEELLGAAYGAAGGTMGTVAGAFTALLFMFFVLFLYRKTIKKYQRKERHIPQESYGDICKVLILTIIPVVMSTAIYNINSIIDSAFYNNIMSLQGYTEQAYAELWGMYSGKYKVLLNVPLGVASALAASVIPSLTAAVTAEDKEGTHEKIDLAIRFAMLIAIPSAVGFAVYASPILQLLFSDANQEPAYILMLGSFAVIVFCLSTITNAILQGINRMTTPIKNASISLVIHLIVLAICMIVLKWNIYAVVISHTVFGTTMCILNGVAIRRYSQYKQEIRKTFVLPFAAAMIMAIVSYVIFYLAQMLLPIKISTSIALVVAGVVYGISLFVTGAVTEDDVYDMPKGRKLVPLLKKCRILK